MTEKSTIDVNFGTKGLQISGTSINKNSESSFGVSVNLKSFKMELEHSSVIVLDGTSTGTYTTATVDMRCFALAFVKVPASQPNLSPVPVLGR